MAGVNITQTAIRQFQRHMFRWWETHRRDLPWRHTHDPYCILVSEVMLQQTQVSRVLPKYQEFLRAFPTVGALASSTPAQVLRYWKGMGYNRRALYLLKTAQTVVHEHSGIFPKTEKELLRLPGLGTYTARALLVFAYRQHTAAVDTNIRQIITHHFFQDKPQSSRLIQTVAEILVPKGKSWEWHQALMDYGATEMGKYTVRFPRASAKEQHGKKLIPFRESNRFFRGRVIDRLREGSISEKKLLSLFGRQYRKDQQFLKHILHGLLKDSLLVQKRGILSLPE